jgi:hypothetical protein
MLMIPALLCHSLLITELSCGAIGASPSLEIAIPDKVIYVNNHHPQADDSNRGINEEFPVRTIGAAAEIAMLNHKGGFSTKVIIYPGTYREQIKMDFQNRKASPVIIFEAKERGTVVLSGSDVWKDWERVGKTDVYVHRWPYKWGFMAGPSQLTQKYGPIVRRREMLFVDHRPMAQVLSHDELKTDTFYVSEEESKIYLSLASGRPWAEPVVEVAVRSDIFEITRGENIIVRGMTFQHDTTGMSTPGGALHFLHSNNILIENCEISWNNWFGLRFTQVDNVTTRRNRANYNGGAGWVGWKIKNLLSQGDETSYNNWRGVKGNFLGWEIAGLKHLSVHDAIYKDFKAIGNHTRGFWLDYDNSNIVIEEGCLCGNLMDGIDLEASEGPITIVKSRICRNQNYGITSDSSRVTLDKNMIYGNGKSQIKHAFANDRPVNNWETGNKLKIHGENWTLWNNIIASESPEALLELSGGDQFFTGLVLEGNVWHKVDRKHLFEVNKKSVTIQEWETMSPGQRSTYANPLQFGINLSDENCR